MESIVNLASHSSKNDILDPLSVVIKLFIYSLKPVGTKISIGNNRLYIQENTYIQGVWRRWNGDNKNDVNILLCPILYACVHYLKPVSSSSGDDNNVFQTIFRVALDGLINMKQTYSGTPIVYNIEHIVNIINLFLKRDPKNDLKKDLSKDINTDLVEYGLESKADVFNEVDSIINVNTPIYKIKENIYHHLDTAWTPHRKNILFGFVKEITEVHNVVLKNELINALAQFMECMDIIVSNVLLNNRM